MVGPFASAEKEEDKQQLIDVDDVDEVNLSEYDGDDHHKINLMDRYSDFRGSHGSHTHSRRSLSQGRSASKSPNKAQERRASFEMSPLLLNLRSNLVPCDFSSNCNTNNDNVELLCFYIY